MKNNAMNILIEKIKEDYLAWHTRRGEEMSPHALKMIEDFNNGLEIKQGRKYTKILSNRSVWGFIVNTENDNKFQFGDILKAAGWATPARNAARGNIYNDEYHVNWTGPDYLV